jgi:membrane-bound lytic murein transglycosylase D
MAVNRTLVTATLAGIFFFTLTGCGPQHVQSSVPAQASAPQVAAPENSSAETSSARVNPSELPPVDESNLSPRDQQIITAVELKYHAGLDKYQNGDMAGARKDFNAAVDQLLMCGVNLQTDKPLRAEFDRVVGSVDTLDLDALKQGLESGQNNQTLVGIANNVTFPVNPKVLAKAEAELKTTKSDLPLQLNNYVASYINFFQNTQRGHDTLVASLQREGRYKDMIEGVLKKNHLPQDLIYQAVAESGFRPTALNPYSGAGGMWQFMPYGTYGLKHNAWVDERFDPVLATEAYARLIKKDYDQFDDWYLAMAAYDWGAGNVQRAVQRTGYASFWQLYRRGVLPAETRNYVPIILAAAIMAKNPDQYGLTDLKLDPPLQYDTVQTHTEISLKLVSDITGASVEQLEAMNPSLLRGVTPPGEAFDLRIPVGTKESFEHDIAMVPADKRASWRFHFVQPGDTLASIAAKYHVSQDELAEVNQIDSPSDLSDLDAVVIPERAPQYMPGRAVLYRVRPGDTLTGIADRFGVSVYQLRIWNHIRGNLINAGHLMRIAAPTRRYYRGSQDAIGRAAYSSRAHATVFTVRSGDNLGGIADRFHVSILDLRRWNHIRGNLIHVGQRLYVSDPAKRVIHREVRSTHHSARRSSHPHTTFYRVRPGDTLGGIAGRFGISITDLRRWNRIRGNLIHIGQRLRVAP